MEDEAEVEVVVVLDNVGVETAVEDKTLAGVSSFASVESSPSRSLSSKSRGTLQLHPLRSKCLVSRKSASRP